MGLTVEQRQAVDLEGKNIIVSAGAGSGKTFVLTERVKRKLLSGVHINELLILTFTNAAAAEMKERIRKMIVKTPGLEDEANLVDSAYITTFDSYSLSVVKKYHTKLNITNNVEISDQVIIDMKKRELLDLIFDEYYLSPKQSFMKLIHDFCLKDDKKLKEYILKAYQKIELKYDKSEYLEHYLDTDLVEERIDSFVLEYVDMLKNKQKDIRQLMESLGELFDGDFVSKMEDNFLKLLSANTYDEFVEGLDFSSIRVPRGTVEEGKLLKNDIFLIAKDIKNLCEYENVREMKDNYLATYSSVSVIVEILKKLDLLLDEYKNKYQIYNFTDVSRMAIEVVKNNPDVLEEIKEGFNEIMVDEYQDTSDIQEMFISLISKNNVYMVGDIKQSIYRFRNANPDLFKGKYMEYQNSDKGIKIDLLKNFRSREEVLNNINLLFDLFMDEKIGGADYKKSHRMVFGNDAYYNEGKTNQNYNLDVLVYDSSILNKVSKDEQEAFIIGYDIQDKINSNYLVFDKDNNKLRPIEYQDIVILLDKSKSFDLYKKIFEYLHIPLSILKEESLKKDEDSYIIRNLFRFLICLKENRFDIEFKYTFLSLCRSFLWKKTDEEIYNIFVNNSFQNTDLYKKGMELVLLMDQMSLSQYFYYVMEQLNYEEKLITVGKIASFRTRLEYFYNLCKSYEQLGNTIYDFTDYLNQIFDGDYDLKFNINTSSVNSCRIMTIHKSKGLEYPICYFAGFSSKFSDSDLKDKIIYDNHYGFILPIVDEYYRDTFLKTLYKNLYKIEDISERIRLLYVALTRAKEKMIIVIPKQEEELYNFDFVPSYQREKYHSFLSIMKSIYSVLLPYIRETNVLVTKEYLNRVEKQVNLEKSNELLNVEELAIDTKIVEERHFSKESLKIVTEEEFLKMEFGTQVHELLERIDFSNYDLSKYHLSPFMVQKIEAFLNSDFMKNKLNYTMYKEYEFLYEVDNSLEHGIIDLLIDEGNSMTIVDYKLKNIDDIGYDKQLNGYRNYITRKTGKKVFCYLYSILDEKYREVLDV